jgi:RHS repeat-associated protein
VAVNVDKTFNLSAGQLATAIGTLTDKTYQLTLRLVNGSDAVVGSNNFSFTLDTTAPQIQIGNLTGASPLAHLVGATDIGGAGRFKVDGGAWNSFVLRADGKFDPVINAAGLAAGLHQVEVQIADAADNLAGQIVNVSIDGNGGFYSSPATNGGWGQILTNGFALYEGNSLVTEKSIDVTFGGTGQRVLEFDLQTSFDGGDTRSFAHDRVAFYLVDANGVALSIDGQRPGSLPVFAYGESGTDTIPGLVQFDGSHVKIDVSGVNASAGRLVVQLLNQDSDGRGNIKVTNFVDRLDAQALPGKAVSPYVAPVTPGAAVVLDGYLGIANGQLLLSDVSFDRTTGKYSADLRVKNVGSTVLSRNLAVLLSDLPAGVTVGNASGIHAAGSAYLNFATAIQAGGLAAGAISGAIRAEINDPNLKAFGFKPVVLQGAAEPIPDLSTLRNLTVKVGDKLDFALDPNLALSIASNVNLPTGSITGDSHLVFNPAPSQIGTYEFTLIARNGSTETRQAVTLNVVADPITTTRVTGIIANTNQAGIAGVLVELAGQQATTDAAGRFQLVVPNGAAGDTLKIYGQRIQGGGITYPFIAEKMNLLLGHDVYQGVNNAIDRPIYLPTIDLSTGTTVNPNAQTIATNPNLSGAQVIVAANSLYDKNGNAFTGVLSITEVPTNLTPAALPPNLHPDLVVTIQPGDMVFNTPAKLTLPNQTGLRPGTEMDLWSINPNNGLFEKVGKGKVSLDGSTINTIEGGIRNSSWHFFSLPDWFLNDPILNPYNPRGGSCSLSKQGINSEVVLQSGAVEETHKFATYESLGEAKGISLIYNSLRADTRPILHFNYDNVDPNVYSVPSALRLVAKVNVSRDDFSYQTPGYAGGNNLSGGENFWRLPAGGGKVDAALQLDLRNQASGQYDYVLDSGILGYSGRGYLGSTSISKGKITIVNDVDSAFGSGWNLSGLEKIIKNNDGSILLVNGNGHELIFQLSQTNGSYASPVGDFSKLEKLNNGTFQRTLKNGIVHQFNSNDQLVSISDLQGNRTEYEYNETGELIKMVEPPGLITNFNYAGHKITSITDPAGRITRMEYDAHGNLVKITDPDGQYRQWEYDADHHMTAAIDKQGQRGEDFYDFAGRAYKGVRPDGSVVYVSPVEVQGLYRPELTNNPDTAPIANPLGKPKATYTDGNGHPLVTEIDQYGQAIASLDAVGKLTTIDRDINNLVTQITSATGNKIGYTYDEKGNLTAINEQIVQPGTKLNQWIPQTPVTFDGHDSYVSLDNSGLVGNSPNSTVELWVKLNQLGNNHQTLYSETKSDGNAFEIAYNSGFLEFKIWRSDIPGNWSKISSSFSHLQEWVQVTSVLDAQKGMQLYINGDLVAANLDSRPSDSSEIKTILGGSSGSYLNGEIGDLRVWNTARSTQQIKDDVAGGNLTGREVGLVGYWQFTSGRGNTVNDLSGHGHNGELKGSANWDLHADSNTPTQLIYSNDFEHLVGSEWSSSQVENSALPLTKFLGRFGNETTTLTLDTKPGETYNINFDFYTIDSWDGSETVDGPDYFNVAIDGTQVFHNTFSFFGTGQTFRPAERLENYGFAPYSNWKEGIYRSIPLTFIASSNFTKINFSGSGLQPVFDESWGIDNVRVSQITGLNSSTLPIDAQRHYTYDSRFNQLTSFTDELGHKTLYDLDPRNGKVIKSTRIVGQLDTASSETDDIITSYTYDFSGQLDTLIDALGHVTDYDRTGYVTRKTSAKGTSDEIIESYVHTIGGSLANYTDALGHQSNSVYNVFDKAIRTIDALGGITTYSYDLMANPILATDSLGHSTKKIYDSRRRLVSNLDANGGLTTYTYDNNGNVLSITDPLKRVLKYQYDGRNRLVSKKDADGNNTSVIYDLNDNIIGITDSLGNSSRASYDSRDNLIRTVDALGNVTAFSYDAANQLIKVIDALGHGTSYQYDELGRQTAIIDSLGYVARTEYDKLDNVTAWIDPKNNRTEYKYDALNRQIEVKDAQGSVTKTAYDKAGNIISVTDPLNHLTTFEYDALDRLIHVTDAVGNSSTRAFDSVGNLLGVTDALGRTTSYGYDNLNRQISTTDALGQTKLVAYDAADNVVGLTNELAQVTGFTYDALNRRTKITDALGHVQTTVYDSESNVRSITDALGNTTFYDYDALNRQVKKTDAKGGITSTNYDVVGNLAKITDSIGNSTTYSYDALDRLITDTNQLGFSRHYAYDAVGNEIEQVDRNGRKTTYGYDNLNRNTSEKWIGAAGENLKSIGYTYDAAGRLVTESDPDSKYTFGYDAVDRLTSVDNTGTTGVPAVVFTYAYDGVSNLVSVFDKINGVSAGQTSYTHDLLNRVTRITQSGTGVQSKRVDMTYNKVNQMTGLTRFSDLGGVNLVAETSYTYDQNQKLVQLAHKKGTTNLASYDYTYDSANRLTKVNSSVDGATDYTYDFTNQLTGADNSSQTDEAYQYDANGNRINAGYQTGTNNQLLTDGQFTYQYDQEGNRTKRTEILTGKVTEYIWDYRNRLAGVVIKDAAGGVVKSIEYTYDVDNQRIGKKIDTSASLSTGGVVTERYVIDRDQIALVFDGQGIQKARYLYGTEIDQVIAEESTAGVHWFLADEQGTIKDVVNNTGTVIDHITYDSFGRIVGQTSAIDLRFAYTGREWDGETGQYYYRARYYDPMIGGFINEDPLGFEAGDTNLKRYVGNSPTNYTDPSGEIFWVAILLVPVAYVAAQALFPNNAQTPMHVCDNHPTPPDQEFKRDLVELAVGGADVAPSLVKSAPGLIRAGGRQLGKLFGEEAANACFTAGTIVFTLDGSKAIENVKQGEFIWSYDHTMQNWIPRKVEKCLTHQYQGKIFNIEVNGEVIEATANHPFWVAKGQELENRPYPEDVNEYERGLTSSGRWVAADSLQIGDMLMSYSKDNTIVTSIVSYLTKTLVYNLEIEEFHCYAVSNTNILVHNKSVPFPRTPSDLEFLKPNDIKFTQGYASPNFSDGGTISEAVTKIRAGELKATDFPPIKIVEKDGALYTLDNRRLATFNAAGADRIPVQRVSLEDPAILKEFLGKSKNMIGDGTMIQIATQQQRKMLK